jgi:hypothetical protein
MSVPERAPEATQAPDPVRAVFRTALRDMLLLLAALAVLGVGVGALGAGRPGVWGALLGVAMTLVFSGTTIVSMLVTARSSAATTGAAIMGTWLVKMIVLIGALVALRGLDFYDRSVLGIVLLVGVLGAVLLDYLAVRRGRVPYTEPGAGQVS